MASETENQPFYNVFDGTAGRVESNYLDMQEREEAEILRAKAEGREPNTDDEGNLPGAVGTPVVPEARRVDNRYYSNPSTVVLGERDVDPIAELPVDTGTADNGVDLSQAAQFSRERQANDQALADADQGGEPSESGAIETGPTPSENDETPTYNSNNPEGV